MIQRIQTIYLLLVVILHSFLLELPVYQAFAPGGESAIIEADLKNANAFVGNSGGPVEENLTYGTMGLNILLIVLALITIFLFRNRGRQLLMTRVLLLISIVLNALIFFLIFSLKSRVPADMQITESWGVGAFLGLASIPLLLLAARGIRKDEALVRSAERLR